MISESTSARISVSRKWLIYAEMELTPTDPSTKNLRFAMTAIRSVVTVALPTVNILNLAMPVQSGANLV